MLLLVYYSTSSVAALVKQVVMLFFSDVEKVVDNLYGSSGEPVILIGHRFVHLLFSSLGASLAYLLLRIFICLMKFLSSECVCWKCFPEMCAD